MRKSCTDPDQVASTLVNSSLELQIACTLILATTFRLKYLGPASLKHTRAKSRAIEHKRRKVVGTGVGYGL